KIAAGRPVIFKLHPAEQHDRASREVRSIAPDALILTEGNTEQMIANSAAVVAGYSTGAFTAALLGKEVHSYVEPEGLRRVLPLQNGGTSASRIADVCRACLASNPIDIDQVRSRVTPAAGAPHLLGELRVMPQAGETSFVYPIVQGIRQALRRRPTTAADQLPRAVSPAE